MPEKMITIMAPAKSEPDIKIQIKRNFSGINISSLKLRKLIKAIFHRYGEKKFANHGTSAIKYEISIVVVDDIEFRKINKQFLHHNSISDCLSFDLSDDENDSQKTFELVINGQMALRQAKLRVHSSEAEFALYIAHGLLHNFGFDDANETMARKMHEKEDEILQELGYGFVYNKSVDSQEKMNRKKRKYKK
jgi:probable rRNA maturation factor